MILTSVNKPTKHDPKGYAQMTRCLRAMVTTSHRATTLHLPLNKEASMAEEDFQYRRVVSNADADAKDWPTVKGPLFG